MLVLSRKKNEAILIGEIGKPTVVVVTVVEIRGDKIRLGIDAPREVPVHRREIHEAIEQQHQQQLRKETRELTND